LDLWSTDTTIRGGDNETDMKAFAVMPWGRASSNVVTTVTPVANRPKALRKALVSKEAVLSAAGLLVDII
jgi:hypothetical protein